MPTLNAIELTDAEHKNFLQVITNQFDMENDTLHDGAWMDVAAFRQLAAKSDSLIAATLVKHRDAYGENVDRILALQRFMTFLQKS